MKDFAELIATNPPRIVVSFRRNHDGSEEFEWGIVGNVPVLTLIGHLVAVQRKLCADEYISECPESAFVMAWDDEEKELRHFISSDIPEEPLVGMLEVIKGVLVGSRLAQMAAAQQTRIMGPDGRPMRR